MARSTNGGLVRRTAFREKKKVIYVFCEGSITEADYLSDFVRSCGQRAVAVLKPCWGAGVPMTIVEKCIEFRRIKRSIIDPRDELWAVFDVDNHPRILEAFNLAKQHKVGLGVSNPCIEVWGLLHFGEVDSPMTRQEAQHRLKAVMPGYDHNRNPRFVWEQCVGRIDDAIKNAKRGREKRAEEGSTFPDDVPSSSFYELMATFLE